MDGSIAEHTPQMIEHYTNKFFTTLQERKQQFLVNIKQAEPFINHAADEIRERLEKAIDDNSIDPESVLFIYGGRSAQLMDLFFQRMRTQTTNTSLQKLIDQRVNLGEDELLLYTGNVDKMSQDHKNRIQNASRIIAFDDHASQMVKAKYTINHIHSFFGKNTDYYLMTSTNKGGRILTPDDQVMGNIFVGTNNPHAWAAVSSLSMLLSDYTSVYSFEFLGRNGPESPPVNPTSLKNDQQKSLQDIPKYVDQIKAILSLPNSS